MQIDLTLIAALWMGGAVLLVPLAAYAARFGVVPVLDALARLRRAGSPLPGDEALGERLAAIEHRLEQVASRIDRMAAEDRSAA